MRGRTVTIQAQNAHMANVMNAVVLSRATTPATAIKVCSERLPAGLDGFRIAQITDTHLGTVVRPEAELRRLVDSVNSLRPDLIVFCGDLVNIRSSELDARARQLLGGLRAPYGVVSVTGNHDAGLYIKDTVAQSPAASLAEVIARQRAMGWNVLEDTTIYLRRGGDSISLTGLSFDPALRHKRHDPDLPPADLSGAYRGVPDSLYNITAVHIPQLWGQIADAGYGDLTLAGHVHSMQIKLRLFGRAFSPAQLLYTRWSGRYDEGGRHALYQRRQGIRGFPDAPGSLSRNHPDNPAKMRVTLSAAVTADGYMDDDSPRRLIISTPGDWEEVYRLRAAHDAILAGAETLRRDDPSIRRSMPRFSSSVTMYLAVIASLVEMTVATFCNPVISPGENT